MVCLNQKHRSPVSSQACVISLCPDLCGCEINSSESFDTVIHAVHKLQFGFYNEITKRLLLLAALYLKLSILSSIHWISLPQPPCLVNKADFQWASWHPMAADVGTGCAKRKEVLCNHFYFPLPASLLSDLDCISQGRQRQNKGMLVMECVWLLLGVTQGKGEGCWEWWVDISIKWQPSWGGIDFSWSMRSHLQNPISWQSTTGVKAPLTANILDATAQGRQLGSY